MRVGTSVHSPRAERCEGAEVEAELRDTETLRQCVESIVPTIVGAHVPIVRVQRRRSDYSSCYASDIVTVTLATGDELTVFLKDFSSFRHPEDGMAQRRQRKICVYRDLLAQAGLGTARYYGSVWDESPGRFWLLLEFVNGTPVCSCDFDGWLAAASWLGGMHGYFAQHIDEVRACTVLVRHNAPFFHSTAARALQVLSNRSPELAGRLVPIVERYKNVVDLMVIQPTTLVHGAYRAEDILLDIRVQPTRICPVDWELAAIGSGLYDLAVLVDGFEPPRLDQLFDAYRRAAMRCGMEVPYWGDMKYLVDCFRLHRVMTWISKADQRNYPRSVEEKLVNVAEQVNRLV